MSLSQRVARARVSPNPVGRPMGDPGLFGFLGDIGKKILGIGGDPRVQGIIGGALGGLAGGRPMAPTPPVIPGVGFVQARPGGPGGIIQQAARSVAGNLPQVNLPFVGPPGAGISFGRVESTLPAVQNGMSLVPPRGHHLNKTSYFLRDGTFVPEGTRFVKNRRRNPLNPRALDRAIRRVSSAKKASKVMARISIRKEKC